MINKILCYTGLLIFFAVSPCYAQKFTLRTAIEQALRVNPAIQEQVYAMRKAKMDKGVAQSNFLPRISLVANSNHLSNKGGAGSVDDLSQSSTSYGVRASLSLFAGFAHLSKLQQSKIEENIAKLTHEQAELELIVNIQIEFFSLLQARRNLRLIKDSIQRIETQLEAAEAFSKEGMAPYVNVLQNRVELSQAKEELIKIKNTIRSHEISLNHFLAIPSSQTTQYIGNIEDYSLQHQFNEEEALQLASRNRPDIRIAQLTIETVKKNARVIGSAYLPKVDLTYDNMYYDRDYDSKSYKDYDRDYWSVGLNLTWSVFDGGKTGFEYASERNRMKSLQFAYKDAIAKAQAEVMKSCMDIVAMKEVFDTAYESVGAAKEGYEQSLLRYEKRLGTITELLDAQTRLTEAEVSTSQAMVDYQIARAKYYFYTGQKTKKIE